jgi:hypothetical protein
MSEEVLKALALVGSGWLAFCLGHFVGSRRALHPEDMALDAFVVPAGSAILLSVGAGFSASWLRGAIRELRKHNPQSRIVALMQEPLISAVGYCPAEKARLTKTCVKRGPL